MVTAQTLEWLRLVEAAHVRQRRIVLLDNAIAARAGQTTNDGWSRITSDLEKKINERAD